MITERITEHSFTVPEKKYETSDGQVFHYRIDAVVHKALLLIKNCPFVSGYRFITTQEQHSALWCIYSEGKYEAYEGCHYNINKQYPEGIWIMMHNQYGEDYNTSRSFGRIVEEVMDKNDIQRMLEVYPRGT